MPRYIDAEALVAEFKRLTLGENSIIERIFADGVYAVIDTFPAADVVPQSELEQLKKKYDLAVAEHEVNVKGFVEQLSNSKAVASDILTQIYKEAGDGDECYGIRVKVAELAKKYNAKFKQEAAPIAIYRGFCSHDCEAHYACPVCGGGFGSWSINNNDVRCPHCKAELRLPR